MVLLSRRVAHMMNLVSQRVLLDKTFLHLQTSVGKNSYREFSEIQTTLDLLMVIIKGNLCHSNSALSVFSENTGHL